LEIMTHSRSLPTSTKSMLLATSVLILASAVSVPACAQSVTFAGTQITVGSGLTYPTGVAVDAAGDIFIADANNNRVVEVPAGGGAQTTVGSGLSFPHGVAVDGAGDVFIADSGNNRVVKIPAGGGAQTTVGGGLNSPYDVAVDGAGDVLIADTYNSRVVEVPAGGGAQTTVGGGLAYPFGVVVDGVGNVFIADSGNNRVVEVPAGGGAQTIVAASGLISPSGVAVDGLGNVFIGDTNNSRVVEVPAGGGAQTTVTASGLNYPYGVAVDGAGDVFIADAGNNRVVELQLVAVNFGNVNVCPAVQTSPAPCNQTLTLNYNVAANTTFGAINVVTQGAPNLDFNLSSGSTCSGTISAGGTCTVNATFAPLAPGARMGAVFLTDNSGNVLATTMLHGIGQGPAIAFGPGVQTTVPTSGLVNSYGIALDGAGDLLIADPSNQRVVKVLAGGGPQTTVGSGLSKPFKVTVDGAGNVYIADIGLNQVVKVPADGSPQTTVGSGLNLAYGVAVDGAGDVFIADSGNNRIVEVPADGSPQITLGNGLTDPIGVAVDGAGNVFVADRTGFPQRVVKIPAGGGPQTTVVGGLDQPTEVAVDGAGNVFVADFDGGRILEVPADGSSPTTVGSGMYDPFDMALDGVGNVFIMDWGNSRVVKVQRSQPPTMSFAPTVAGLTSVDSPQSVFIQNIGNQPLDAVTPGLVVGGPNFVQVAGSGTPADCTTSFSLAPGASCNVSISFEPQSVGNLTAAAIFTDNALNTIPSATKSVTLQGTGQATQTGLTQTITFTQPAPASASYYSAFTVAAQSTSGLTVTLSVDAGSTSVCSVGTSSVASGVTSAIVAVESATGICTIDANQAGSGTYDVAAQQQTSATAGAIGTSLAVTNTNDSGFGSLRDAIANAVSGDTITFSLLSPATITLASPLTINTSLTISGPGASSVAISGNNAVQVMSISGGTTVTVSGVTIENGNLSTGSFPEGANLYGGGIANAGALTLSNCVVSGNAAGTGEFPYYSNGYGGGIFNSGTLTVSNCTVSGNSANVGEFGFNVNAYGGGIANSGTLTVSDSTFTGNTANVGAFAYYADGYGGGIANSGTLTLLNSTISGNSSNLGAFGLQMSGYGGGIANSGTLTLSNTTIWGNSDSVGEFSGGVNLFGAGIVNGQSVYGGAITNVGTMTVKDSIVANHPSGGNCGGTIASQGYNLSDDGTCAASFTQTGDLNNTAAGLDPGGLKTNGGSTQTIALLAGSAALDAIPLNPVNYCTDTSGNAVTTDQNGVTRPQGTACDMGAYELPETQAGQTSQTVTFTQPAPASASYNGTFLVAAQSSSGLAVTLSVDSGSTGVCGLTPAVAGGLTKGTVTMLSGTGVCTIFAIQSGNGTYSAAPLQHTSTAAQKLTQTITFTQPAPASASYYSAFTVAAQSTSGLTVTLSVDAGSTSVCSVGTSSVASGVTSATVAMLAATGICAIDANQAGNSNYSVAAQQQTSATAGAIGTSLAVTNTNDSGFGSLRDAIANAVSGDTITFSLPSPATITLASPLTINTNLTISGPGATSVAISGNNAVQVMSIAGGTTVTVSGVTIENGNLSTGSFPEGANLYGGGIANAGALTLSNCVVSGNAAGTGEFPYYSNGYGGGIFNSGTLTVSNCTVSGNSASVGEFGFNVNAYGGGIANSGTLTLLNSTISGNSSNVGAFAYYADGYGGGIANSGTLTLLNSTISGNSSNLGAFGLQMSMYGGGIANSGTLTLSNTTIWGNSDSVGEFSSGVVEFGAGITNGESINGGVLTSVGTMTVKNSIVANHPSGGNCGGTIASQGYNLSDDGTCAASFTQTGDLNNTAAGLDPGGLKANGGSTQTIALLAGSAALDAIPLNPVNYCTDTSGNAVTTDQNGVTRPQGTACDMGAYELPETQAGQTSQTVTFTQPAPASASYNGTFLVAAQSSSGLAVTLSVDSGSVGVCGLGTPGVAGGVTSATVTMLSGTGVCTIFAIQSGNGTYSAAPLQHTSTAAQKLTQTITFSQSAPTQAQYNSSFAVVATGASASPVTFTSSGACSNVSATYTMTSSTGTCSVIADQAGDNNYLPAPTVTQTVAATLAIQRITFPTVPTPTYGAGPITLNATANSGLAISYGVTSGPASVNGDALTISGAGSVTVQASQSGDADYLVARPVWQTFTVNQATQTITFPQSAPAQAQYNSSFTVAATATSGDPVSFSSSGVCTNVGSTFTMTNSAGTCTVTASQSGDTNYLAAPIVTQTSTAEKAVQIVTFTGAPATAPYQNSFTVAATTNSGIAPTITASGVCSIIGTIVSITSGTGVCTITAKWAVSANYLAAATATQHTTAEKAASGLNWTTPAPIAYGTALSGVQLDATANVAGSFVYSPAAGTVPKVGNIPLKVTFTPTLNKDYTTETVSVALQVSQPAPIITWTTPAAIPYGTALGGSQLDATANIAGKFVYSPAPGKVLTPGSQSLSVTFTPTDHIDYGSAKATVTLEVDKAGTATTITSNTPNPSTHGRAVVVHFTVVEATNYKPPTGKVTVNASTGETCTGTLASGSGSCSLTFSAAGPKTLTATYAGDSNNNSSISAGVAQTVN
jgi:sugar lactone lactonase YvrE